MKGGTSVVESVGLGLGVSKPNTTVELGVGEPGVQVCRSYFDIESNSNI